MKVKAIAAVGACLIVLVGGGAFGTMKVTSIQSTRTIRICDKPVEPGAAFSEPVNEVMDGNGTLYAVSDTGLYVSLERGKVYLFTFTNKYDIAVNQVVHAKPTPDAPVPPCPKKPA